MLKSLYKRPRDFKFRLYKKQSKCMSDLKCFTIILTEFHFIAFAAKDGNFFLIFFFV